jgi:hypothetical protein
MIDCSLLLDMELVDRIRSYPAKSSEFISAKNEIISRHFEEIKKAVHIFCMPSPEDEAVARDLFGDIERVLMGFKKGMSLRVFLSSYARKNIALPRWKQKPSFYMAAYSGGILTVTGLLICIILSGGPALKIRAGSIFDGKNTAVIHIDRSCVITLGRDAVIEAVSGISGDKVTADFRLDAGSVECSLRKLSKDEFFRLGNSVASIEVRGTDFKARFENGVFRVDVVEGRVMLTDRIRGTNFILNAPGHYETAGKKHLVKQVIIDTPGMDKETGENLNGPRNVLDSR